MVYYSLLYKQRNSLGKIKVLFWKYEYWVPISYLFKWTEQAVGYWTLWSRREMKDKKMNPGVLSLGQYIMPMDEIIQDVSEDKEVRCWRTAANYPFKNGKESTKWDREWGAESLNVKQIVIFLKVNWRVSQESGSDQFY